MTDTNFAQTAGKIIEIAQMLERSKSQVADVDAKGLVFSLAKEIVKFEAADVTDEERAEAVTQIIAAFPDVAGEFERVLSDDIEFSDVTDF